MGSGVVSTKGDTMAFTTLLLGLFLGFTTGQGSTEQPGDCSTVSHAGVNYFKLTEGDTGAHGCKDSSIYVREDAPDSRFCFKESFGSDKRDCRAEIPSCILQDVSLPLGTKAKPNSYVVETFPNIRSAGACGLQCQSCNKGRCNGKVQGWTWSNSIGSPPITCYCLNEGGATAGPTGDTSHSSSTILACPPPKK